MAVVLEKLVAKGRRVHHARDQREVAFGLAALSTKKEILVNILKKGGVRTLAHLLKSSSDVEARRFTALALANTACIGNYKLDFVTEDECLDGILSELRNDDSDLAVRQYCAMAIGNLAADFETHDSICARGGPFALTYFLKAVAEEKDVEAGIYVTLAISNLAMNPNHRHKFIQYGAIESLVHIACWDDWNVKCKALMALRSICMSYELRAVVLKAGVIDPLVIISRSENKSVLREVAAMFHCLSTVAEKKNEISDRALSTITSLFFQHDYVIERHASSTIANLTEENAMHQRFLMESGLDHILALYKICHVDAKVQVMRSLSNLSRNKALHSHLLSAHILRAAVEGLSTLEMNCQKFSAAFFANLTVDPASHAFIIHEGAICPLVHNIMMIGEDIVSVEAKRYAALTLANISSTTNSHEIIVQAQGIEAMLSLSKSADYLSQKNVACTFANFASNTNIHFNIVKKGIIQSITYLGQNKDLDIHLHLTAALRGMSVNTNISVKIVQEGGLNILLPLLLSNNALVLRDTTACLYNLSLTTENKLEILQVGCIPLLKRLIEYDDSEVSGNSCACLTNFAEISSYQFSIASEGGIKASMIAMRSKFLELQRKSGRLFSLLCACNSNQILNEIIENEGHRFLISFLTSHDSYVIHSGVLGILNLSSYKEYSANIGKTDLLGLLLNIIRSEDLNSELRKMAMMSVVNLSDNINNHLAFVKEGMIDAMTSIYNSPANQMRTYAALVVANIAKNMNMSEVVTNCAGGIESILHLARINHSYFHRNVLGAIASLSFIKKNNEQICFQSGIKPLLEYFQAESRDSISFNAFCCAIANLSEHVECNHFLTELGIVPPLMNVLTKYELENVDEAIRALGNLALNRHLCLDILQSSNIIPKVLRVLNSGNESSVRMAYMMMTNLAANVKIHDHMLRVDILSPIAHYLKIALNHPKLKESDETISYVLLLVANLWANEDNHDMTAKNVVDLVVRYTKHRDVRCRQNAVICLGNLCSRPSTVKRFRMNEIPKIFISFAYTPCHNETFYAQFQAIAGIRGLAFHHDFRTKLVREGCSEPLVLTLTRFRDEGANLPLSREASAAIFNLTLSSDTYLLLVQSGIVSGLSNLIELRDTIAQPYAIGSLANLARNGYHEKLSMFDEITPLMFHNTVTSCWLSDETKKELARCLVHFSRDVRCRQLFERDYELLEYTLTNLITKDEMVSCQTHSLLSYANLIKNIGVNHSSSLPTILNNLHVLVVATKNHWISRCVAFALNIICQRTITHNSCEKYGVAYLLVKILSLEDEISNWYACIALKHFSAHTKGATKFVEGGGLVYLFVILNTAEREVRVEVLSCLRNLSIPEVNKLHVLQKGGLPALLYLMKSPDTEVSYRACSVVANLAESNECLQAIMDAGVMHDLKISLGSDCDKFDCEALRLLSTISSGSMCIHLADSFLLTQLSQFLLSKCKLCTRYACMSIANLLALDEKTRLRLVEKGLVQSLVSEIRQGQDEKTKNYALIALSNISKAKQLHDILHRSNIIELVHNFLAKNDESFIYSAALCLSNLASNAENHIMLHSAGSMNIIKSLLDDSNRNLKLCALSFVRGASASGVMVKEFFHLDISTHLLRYAEAEDREIQIEAISALCNMSRSGIIGHETKYFFQCIGMKKLVTFLCDGESTFYLFAAIVIGNISSEHELQEAIMSTGALGTILRIINELDSESRRCMTYALCNLSCSNSNARGKIISSDAGLSSIFSLGYLGNDNDLYISVSTIRELSSFSELRKIIVDNKGLDYLFHVYENHTNPKCLKEAADALCLLSLDDDNKVNIVQHKILQQVFHLALIDMNEVSSLSLRTLANCCEIESLHGRVIKHMDEAFFHKLVAGIGADTMEISRFICNISSVSDNQLYLLRTDHVMHIILELLTRDCSATLTNIAMALLNFSANREIHGNLCVFRDKIVESVFRIFGCNKIGIRAHYFLCISVGCLLVNHEFHNLFRVSGLTNLLIEFLSNSDVHMKFQATFAFHLFLRKQEGAILPKNENLDISLLNAIKGLDPKLSLHGICSLRYLSIEPDHARNIVKNYGLEVITHALYRADGDMQREISHLFCHLSCIPELRCLVFKSDAFGSMIKMLEKATPTCNCLTLTALANCLEDSSSLKHAPCIENTAKMVLKRITDRSLCVKSEAHRALANLLSCHEVMASVTSLDLFNIITSDDIFASNHTIQLCITVTLRKLSAVSSFRNFMIHHEEAMKMICDFCCGRNNKDIIIHAGNALKNLSKYRQTRELVVRKGGTTAAIGLLKHDCEEINIVAVAVLYHLSFESKIKYLLYNEDILSLVYNLISKASLMDAFSYASLLLSNLAEDDEVRKFMWQENVISALKRLGSLNSTLSVVGVSKCIFLMSMSVNDTTPRNSIHELVNIVRRLLQSESRQVKNNAASILGNFAEYLHCHEILNQSNILDPLLNLVQTTKDYHDDSLVCCWALSKILIYVEEDSAVYRNLLALLHSLTHCVLSQRNTNETSFGSMVLCNLSAINSTHDKFVKSKWIPILASLLKTTSKHTTEITLKTLCNLSKSEAVRKQFVQINGVEVLFELVKKDTEHYGLVAFILCEIVICEECKKKVLALSGLVHFTITICDSKEPDAVEACWMLFYRMSKYHDYHKYLLDTSVIGAMSEVIENGHERGKIIASMTLCNLAANDALRSALFNRGAFDFALSFVKKNSCQIVRSYGALLIANLTYNLHLEYQLYLPKAVTLMLNLLSGDDYIVQRSAIVSLVNISNHSTSLPHDLNADAIKLLRKMGNKDEFKDMLPYISFSFANFTCNRKILDLTGENSGIEFIVNMIASSDNVYSRWVGISAIKKLTETPSNRERIMVCTILDTIMSDCNLNEGFIRNEVSECLLNLSKDCHHRAALAEACMPRLILLFATADVNILARTCDSLALLTESGYCGCLDMKDHVLSYIAPLLEHGNLTVRRASSKLLSNLLSFDGIKIGCDLLSSLLRMFHDEDRECRRYASSAFRNIALKKESHHLVMRNLIGLLDLTHSNDEETKSNAILSVQTLSVEKINRVHLVERRVIETLTSFISYRDPKIQVAVLSTLENLSSCPSLRSKIMSADLMIKIMKILLGAASYDLCLKLVRVIGNLSEEHENCFKMIDVGIVSATFVVSKSECPIIQENLSRLLVNLSACRDAQLHVYQQGVLECFTNLTYASNSSDLCIQNVSLGIQLLFSNAEVRLAVVKENRIESLMNFISHPRVQCVHCTCVALSLISVDEESRSYLLLIVESVFKLLYQGTIQIQRAAMCVFANLAESIEMHESLVNMSIVKRISNLVATATDSKIVQDISRFLAFISIHDTAKEHILVSELLPYVIKFSRRTDEATQRYSTLVICNLALHPTKKVFCYKDDFMRVLTFLTKCHDLEVERCSFLTLGILGFGVESEYKELLSNDGIFNEILKGMNQEHTYIKQTSSLALNSILLNNLDSIRRKWLGRDCELSKTLSSLLEVSDDGLCVHNAIYAVGSLIEIPKIRHEIVDKGYLSSVSHVLRNTSCVHTKRACAYFYSVIYEYPEYHHYVQNNCKEFGTFVDLLGSPDSQCKSYGVLISILLASNKDLQVALVKRGAVRHLTSIIELEEELYPYAGFALLKLADNFENHIAFSEQGGIRALLKLGAIGRIKDEDNHNISSPLSLAKLAFNAIKGFKPVAAASQVSSSTSLETHELNIKHNSNLT